jgi:hypothetical protein
MRTHPGQAIMEFGANPGVAAPLAGRASVEGGSNGR